MTVQRKTRSAPASPDAPKANPPRLLDPGEPSPIVILPMAAISTDHLGVGELLDIAEHLNTDLEGVAALMQSRGIARARFLVALAWVVARRTDPSITWEEAQRWRIEVKVSADPDPTTGAPPSAAPDG